jgi:plastocyanin
MEVLEMLNKSRLNFALILALVICAVAVTGRALNARTNPNEIVIENFSFEPATLTVKVGTTVTWVNKDDEPHTATATDKRFNSKTLDTGDRFSQEFNAPGIYNYYCALHPKMTGKIIVK